MKFLNTTPRFAVVTIESRQAVDFVVPVEIAALVFWFLASRSARLVALVACCLVRDLVNLYHSICDLMTPGQLALRLGSVMLDLFGARIACSCG